MRVIVSPRSNQKPGMVHIVPLPDSIEEKDKEGFAAHGDSCNQGKIRSRALVAHINLKSSEAAWKAYGMHSNANETDLDET